MNASTGQPLQRTPELLQRLVDAEVELTVIGGIAAVAWGSTQFTKDLDLTAPFTAENLQRLMGALGALRPRFYQTIGKPEVKRSIEELLEFRNLYFLTDWGIVDILRTVPPIGEYERVRRDGIDAQLFERSCRIIGLDDLIAVKHFVRRPKDLLVAAELEAIREKRATKP